MKEIEIWKLVQRWIAIESKTRNCSFLEHIASLNEQNQKLKAKNLELFYEECESIKETTFFIIEPYFVKMYHGEVIEKNGTITIENWTLLKQIACDDIEIPEVVGRSTDYENPFDIITAFTSEEAYILDGTCPTNLNYYQEKDEDGLYGRLLETTHFMKIGKAKTTTIYQRTAPTILCSTLHSFETIGLIEQETKIIPVFKQYHSASCFAIVDTTNSLFEKQVEKIYQL